MEVPELYIRKSPISIIQYFLLAEILSLLAFFLPETLLDYEKLYSKLSFSTVVRYEVMFFIIVTVMATIPVVLMIIYWLRSFYTIENNKITVHKIFSERIYTIKSIKSIKVFQSNISTLLNTRNVNIYLEDGKTILLKNISEPAYYSRLIESSFALQNYPSLSENIPIEKMIEIDENKNLEFKSSLCWDVRKKSTNKDVTKSVMKTLTAFMNSDGGVLVIGVNDKREVLGLEDDIKTLKRKDLDGLQNFFTMLFNDYVGAEFSNLIKIKIERINDKNVLAVTVKPSETPAYVKNGQGEEFFIRVGNATYPLSIKGATQYIGNHFTK